MHGNIVFLLFFVYSHYRGIHLYYYYFLKHNSDLYLFIYNPFYKTNSMCDLSRIGPFPNLLGKKYSDYDIVFIILQDVKGTASEMMAKHQRDIKVDHIVFEEFCDYIIQGDKWMTDVLNRTNDIQLKAMISEYDGNIDTMQTIILRDKYQEIDYLSNRKHVFK